MGFTLLGAVVLVLAAAVLLLLQRRAEVARLSMDLDEREQAIARGSHRARLQHPHVDLSSCMGCGACVRACPEDGVLELIHGQAMVVHGARCVGHGLCAEACPVGAISITLGDLTERRDIPVLTEHFESTRARGVFLAGEVTGYALIRTAIAQGTAVADEVARRVQEDRTRGGSGVLDLVVVGAGPAGIACSLQSKLHGLSFAALEQAELGGTVSKYPRRKLVMTQPVSLPLHGTLSRTTYEKEELVALWHDVAAKHDLPIRTGVEFQGLDRTPDGTFLVDTNLGRFEARNVCLALGRRGTPRRLGVAGEELSKVVYSLIDAQSYSGRRILVVGGGDSAVEAALGLAEQSGNVVHLSYRKGAFTRLKSRNEARLERALAEGRVIPVLSSEVTLIEEGFVHLRQDGQEILLPNDEVFVMAGGIPPFQLLESAGISFDPSERPAATQLVDRGTGLVLALSVALLLAVAAAAWVYAFRSYYGLDPADRHDSPWHALLRPAGTVGLACGIGALVLIATNLAYLARRSRWFGWVPGSLRSWMTAHVATGIGSLLLVLVHSAMISRNTVGGHALAALAILLVTGAVGRYLYAFVPRAANGRELELDEVRANLTTLSSQWDRISPELAELVQVEVRRLTSESRWQSSLPRRIAALLTSQHRLRATLARLRREARRAGAAKDQVEALAALAERAQRAALAASHFEDLRALLASWRYLHRWVALAMVLLAAVHVRVALRFAGIGN
ncbi:MAG: NAD(P)-binding domain-containing protein [Planctomycetota bacterium]